ALNSLSLHDALPIYRTLPAATTSQKTDTLRWRRFSANRRPGKLVPRVGGLAGRTRAPVLGTDKLEPPRRNPGGTNRIAGLQPLRSEEHTSELQSREK